ncbi:DNA polymerase III subunit delta' [Roseinatronobacter sp.]|uniref:DNA polymerase III subunit delta' n=1 Tax=Roseinatronobacter sp. TaxID=1945755 RepID=UPI0025E65477|nr:DNA polymerase III subunit delta' [Roseibaca sp.]
MSDLPDLPDQREGAPHPCATPLLFGQQAAEAAFLQAFASGRMHHAWLLSGPMGVGKATLAWRIARFLLAGDRGGMFGPPDTLDVPEDHPTVRRLRAGADGGLLVIRRGLDDKGNLRRDITVDVMRRLHGFFGLSAADGGQRVVIVDAADEMNTNAANALLKALEEPPANATLLLVAHQPSRLLPTIRSRCRDLRLSALDTQDFAQALTQAGIEGDPGTLAELSGGSVGQAVELALGGGAEIYADLVALFATLPRMDRARALRLAESMAGKGNETRFSLFLRLFDLFMARAARAGVLGPGPEAVTGEAALLARIAPHAHAAQILAELAPSLSARARHGRAVNLDPAALVLDMVLKTEEGLRPVLGQTA